MAGQLEGRLPVGRFLADWLLAGQLEGRLPVGRFPADWLLCGQLDAGAAMRGAACWDGEAAPAWRPSAAVSNLAPANRPDAPAPTIMQS